ncbi:hypothetical protein ACFQU7_26740 [Pseudoroseomonas wenyumeiae]
MTDTETRLDTLLAAPAASGPSYAADGRLYFLCDAGGSAQVWELPAGGGAARPRSEHRDAVAFVAGSPADGSAVFGRDQAGDERIQFYHLPEQGAPRARRRTRRPSMPGAPSRPMAHGWPARPMTATPPMPTPASSTSPPAPSRACWRWRGRTNCRAGIRMAAPSSSPPRPAPSRAT